jgi:hypothetical protein
MNQTLDTKNANQGTVAPDCPNRSQRYHKKKKLLWWLGDIAKDIEKEIMSNHCNPEQPLSKRSG